MNPWKMLTPAVVPVLPVIVVAFSLLPAPANAQQHGRSRGGGGGSARSSSQPSAPRSSSPRTFSAPRSFSGPRTSTAPRSFSTPRTFAAARSISAPQGYGLSRSYGAQRGVAVGRAAPRGIAPRVVGPRVIVGAPFRGFSRPYYSFRPRFSLGFGLYVGYPIAFPYYGYAYSYSYPYYSSYPYPYDPYGYGPAYGYSRYPANPYPYPYGSNYPNYSNYPAQSPPPPGSVSVAPGSGQQSLGGVSFNISPADAHVQVDGQDVGVAGSFSPTSQPLTLTPGQHHIELLAAGYQTIAFDVDIVPGQVIPYQGTMQR